MNLSSLSKDPIRSEKRRRERWILFSLMNLSLISLSLVLLVVCSGCLTKREVQYVSAVKRPEELNGYMRLAQTKLEVNVIGQDQIATFTDDSTKEKRDVMVTKNGKLEKTVVTGISGYIVIHEMDVKRMVQNTVLVQKLLADPEIKALALKKGLASAVTSPPAETVELSENHIDRTSFDRTESAP